MGLPLEKKGTLYTYKDYLSWPDDERWEIIKGVPYAMSPAPSLRHQKISGELFRQLANYFLNKPCQVYDAPVDVLLKNNPDESEFDTTNVVQPDIVIVCDKQKIKRQKIVGSPDLVIEILSPSTSRKDLKDKFNLYEESGVTSYWIISPHERSVMIFKLNTNKQYGKPTFYTNDDKFDVPQFEGLTIDLGLVFKD